MAEILEGLPEKYDPEAMQATLEAALDRVLVRVDALEAAEPAAPAAISEQWPNYRQASQVTLTGPAAGGTYSTVNDPRIATSGKVKGSGLAGGVQRIRFEPGFRLVPLGRLPRDAAGLPLFVFGRLVVGIPHGLGRIPEHVLARSSASEDGSEAQRLVIAGGSNANSLSGVFDLGDEVRADVDFVPCFGRRKADVVRLLDSLFDLSLGGTPSGARNLTAGGDFDWPEVEEEVVTRMIATDKEFSGVLLATSWGLPTFDWNGTVNSISDGVLGHTEQQVSMMTPGVAKSLWAMSVPTWSGRPDTQQVWDDGLELRLDAGSVDLILR